jgi:hypothetical protein
MIVGLAEPPRILTMAARWSRGRQAAVVISLLGAAALVDADRPLPLDLCLWRHLTGRLCPTCGLTRAICHALRGDLSASLNLHPAGLLVVAGLAGWAGWSGLEAWRGESIHEAARERCATAMLRVGLAVSLLSWVVRLAFGSA